MLITLQNMYTLVSSTTNLINIKHFALVNLSLKSDLPCMISIIQSNIMPSLPGVFALDHLPSRHSFTLFLLFSKHQ